MIQLVRKVSHTYKKLFMIIYVKINDNLKRGGLLAMKEKKEKISKVVAKGTVSILNSFLRADANSASCCIIYQPKAPKELSKFRRT